MMPIFFAKIVKNVVSKGKDSDTIFKLVSHILTEEKVYFDDVLCHILEPLTYAFEADVPKNIWFFEKFCDFLDEKNIIFSSMHGNLVMAIIKIYDEIIREMFIQKPGIRTVFQKICSSIIDDLNLIELEALHWLTTCSLKTSKLPSTVFSLCDEVEHFFECEFPTELPISLLILGYSMGCDIQLDMALLDPETASIESRMGLCAAISIALVQLLPYFEENEIERVSKLLDSLSSKGFIECPLGKGGSGYDGFMSLLSYSIYLLENKEVSNWYHESDEWEVLHENISCLLKPVLTNAKETKNEKLLDLILTFCIRFGIKQSLINTLIALKPIISIEKSEVTLVELERVFQIDEDFIKTVKTCLQ